MLDSSGRAAVGVAVVFDGVDPQSHFLDLFVSATGELPHSAYRDTATTDAQGRASTFVSFNTRVGTAFLRVTVPSLGFRDSAAFTIRPGNAARITVTPADTAVLVGNAVALHATLRDRAQNLRPDPVTFTVASGPITVTPAGAVTGTAIGRGTVQVAGGGLAQAAAVSVVPTATVAAYMYRVLNDRPAGRLVLMRSDGAGLRTILTLGADGLGFRAAIRPLAGLASGHGGDPLL